MIYLGYCYDFALQIGKKNPSNNNSAISPGKKNILIIADKKNMNQRGTISSKRTLLKILFPLRPPPLSLPPPRARPRRRPRPLRTATSRMKERPRTRKVYFFFFWPCGKHEFILSSIFQFRSLWRPALPRRLSGQQHRRLFGRRQRRRAGEGRRRGQRWFREFYMWGKDVHSRSKLFLIPGLLCWRCGRDLGLRAGHPLGWHWRRRRWHRDGGGTGGRQRHRGEPNQAAHDHRARLRTEDILPSYAGGGNSNPFDSHIF